MYFPLSCVATGLAGGTVWKPHYSGNTQTSISNLLFRRTCNAIKVHLLRSAPPATDLSVFLMPVCLWLEWANFVSRMMVTVMSPTPTKIARETTRCMVSYRAILSSRLSKVFSDLQRSFSSSTAEDVIRLPCLLHLQPFTSPPCPVSAQQKHNTHYQKWPPQLSISLATL